MTTRTIAGILIVALVALSVGVVAVQYGPGGGAGGAQHVAADGDCACDNIGINGRDSDGNGIPNGPDKDYAPSRDRSGRGDGGEGHRHNR